MEQKTSQTSSFQANDLAPKIFFFHPQGTTIAKEADK